MSILSEYYPFGCVHPDQRHLRRHQAPGVSKQQYPRQHRQRYTHCPTHAKAFVCRSTVREPQPISIPAASQKRVSAVRQIIFITSEPFSRTTEQITCYYVPCRPVATLRANWTGWTAIPLATHPPWLANHPSVAIFLSFPAVSFPPLFFVILRSAVTPTAHVCLLKHTHNVNGP